MEDRKELLVASVGSTNYNLVDELSDYDYKKFVCPTFDDLYNKKMYSNSYTSEECDYTVHDIRKLSELIYKANINFIEVLFATKKQYPMEMCWIIDHASELSIANLPYLYDACIGMYYTKINKIHSGTATTKELVDKYGYDTKGAMCAYRVLDFLVRMAENGFDFGKAIRYEDDDPMRSILMNIKRGSFTESTFSAMIEERKSWAFKVKGDFKSKEVNTAIFKELDSHIYNIVRGSIV